MKIIRDELHDAVFSEDYTATDGGQLMRLPYFDALKELRSQRAETVSMLEQRIEAVTVREKELLAMVEMERSACRNLADTLATTEAALQSLQQEHNTLLADMSSLRAQLIKCNAEIANEHAKVLAAEDSHKQALEAGRATTAELRQFKQEFLAAQHAFDHGIACALSLSYIAVRRTDSKRVVDVGARLVVRGEMAELSKLLKQLCTLRTRAIEEYDIALAGKVRLHVVPLIEPACRPVAPTSEAFLRGYYTA